MKEKGLLGPVNGHTVTTIEPLLRGPSNVVANQMPGSPSRGYLPSSDTTDESLVGLASDDAMLEIENQKVDPDGDWMEPIRPAHVTGNSKVGDELPEDNGDSMLEGQTL